MFMAGNNTHIGSMFVNDIIKNVFKIQLTDERYVNIGGLKCGRNVFSNCILQNAKYLSDNYSVAIKALIMDEIKNKNQKKRFFDYLKKHLSNDIRILIEKNPDEVEKIVDLAISKFQSPDGNKGIVKIQPVVNDIKDLYLKGVSFLKNDAITSFSLVHSLINKIIDYIVENEEIWKPNLKKTKQMEMIKINSISYKKIMPEYLLLIIDSLNILLKTKEISTDTLELVFINSTKIVKWFLIDYLGSETQFTIIEYQAEEIFYGVNTDKEDKEEDSIIVLDFKDLKKKGWSTKKILDITTQLGNEYIPVRKDNQSSFELKVERLSANKESRKYLFDKEDNLIGYWIFFPLYDEAFERAMEGKLNFSEFTADMIPIMLPDDVYNIEFGGTFLIEKYQGNQYAFKVLLYSIIKYIEELALKKKFINKIVSRTSSRQGIALIKRCGFKLHKVNPDGKTKIYYTYAKDLIERPFLKRFRYLRSLYAEKFND